MVSLSLIEIELPDNAIVTPRPVGYMAIKISGESEVGNFVDSDDDLPSNFEVLSTYPNPFNSSVEIIIHSAVAERAEISIWDTNGRLIETVYQGLLTSGENRWNWSAESQTAGSYFLRFTSESQILERKVQYLK